MTSPQPALFEPDALTPGLTDVLGPHLASVVAAAGTGDWRSLRKAERSWAAAACSELGVDVAVSGLEHVGEGPYVVAPLHEGFADVLALLQLPLELTWVIRDELLELPYFGPYLNASGHIPVEPETPRAAWRNILTGSEPALARGESLVVFPQGSILGLDIAFQPGAFRLSRHFGVPLLPIILTGSHRVWEYPFSPRLRRNQRIRMEVLAPVDPADAPAQMRVLERRMKRRALTFSDAPARRYDPARDGEWPGYKFDLDPDLEPASGAPTGNQLIRP